MSARRVVEAVDVVTDGDLGNSPRRIALIVDELGTQRGEEALAMYVTSPARQLHDEIAERSVFAVIGDGDDVARLARECGGDARLEEEATLRRTASPEPLHFPVPRRGPLRDPIVRESLG